MALVRGPHRSKREARRVNRVAGATHLFQPADFFAVYRICRRPDIVTVNPLNNNLHVLFNNGDGTSGLIATYTTGLAARAVTIADVTSDGRPDLIAVNLHSTTISG